MLLLPLLLQVSTPVATGSATSLFSAGELKDRCDSHDPANISYCFAYIAGAYDTVRAYETWLNLREFCVPTGIAQGDLRRAFVDYLNDAPGFRAGEAASVIVVALKKRYPCSAAKPAAPSAPAPAPAPRKR